MLKYQYLSIIHPEKELIELLRKMKEPNQGVFQYQKKLASDYAKNIFASEDHVGCFKTRRTSLAEASVWVVISGQELKVTNITPTVVGFLGITQYNIILNSFFHDFIAKFIDETWEGCISISGENISFSDMLSDATYKALESWVSLCNKDNPFIHPLDLERWMKFVTLLHKDEVDFSTEDFAQWLSEEKKWPVSLNMQIMNLAERLRYSLDLLNYYDGTKI